MKITFIRYGESESKMKNILALDSTELSKDGIKQVKGITVGPARDATA